jgi:hypothetical protein
MCIISLLNEGDECGAISRELSWQFHQCHYLVVDHKQRTHHIYIRLLRHHFYYKTKDMSATFKERTGRHCKYTVGSVACTKYAQWTPGNKGCYCHKHFKKTSKKPTTCLLVDDTRGINDNGIVINASSKRQMKKMAVNASCAASEIMRDLVKNRRENMNGIGQEVATSTKLRWCPLHHIQHLTVQQGDMHKDASVATLSSGSSAGNNSERMS